MNILSTRLARISATLGIVVFAGIASPFAVAADAGWYVGGNVGQSRANIDEEGITDNLLSSGFTTTSIDSDYRDLAFKLFGGYQLNKYFAVEAGYFNLGKFGFSADTVPLGTLDGSIKLQGANLDLVGILPFSDNFSAFARVGVNHAEADDSFTGTGSVNVLDPDPSNWDTNYKFGLGLQYDFTQYFSIRAEAERYRINDAVGNNGDVDLISAGLLYRFGRAAPPPAPRAESPAPPTRVAAVEPVTVPAVRTQQYCSILDMQFEINKGTVQQEYEEKIDTVAMFMKKYPETTAVIEGHTDEVGTAADNMTLSERRARSVVSYLVDRHGISQSRLGAVGYGETRPIADGDTDAGRRLNRRINAIIGCAPDIEGLTPLTARVTMAMEMEFDTNQADIRPRYREELRKVANFMQAHPRVIAIVEGHTSNQRGTAAQAMQLSERRAQNVVDVLATDFGIDRTRLFAAGFGDTRRIAYNTSAEGQQQNRRVNIIFEYPR